MKAFRFPIGERAQAARGNSRRAARPTGRSPCRRRQAPHPTGVIETDLDDLNQLRQARTATGPVDIDLFVGASRYEAILRAELAAIAGMRQRWPPKSSGAQQALMAADRDVRMLEKLHEKQRELHRQAKAAEMKQLDEFAARQSWQQRRASRRRSGSRRSHP